MYCWHVLLACWNRIALRRPAPPVGLRALQPGCLQVPLGPPVLMAGTVKVKCSRSCSRHRSSKAGACAHATALQKRVPPPSIAGGPAAAMPVGVAPPSTCNSNRQARAAVSKPATAVQKAAGRWTADGLLAGPPAAGGATCLHGGRSKRIGDSSGVGCTEDVDKAGRHSSSPS